MSDKWADLSTYACTTCRFFVPKQQVGRCRRHAPTMDGYPVVYADDWCGDHKLGTNPSREDASIIEKTFDTVSWLANPSVVHRDV